MEQEVADARLGEVRLNHRFVKTMKRWSEKPGASIPKAMKNEAESEAYYRLMRNPALGHFELLQPHLEHTKQRAEALKTVLVAHDTTEFAFDVHDEFERENLARLSARRQGFLWHASLTISADALLRRSLPSRRRLATAGCTYLMSSRVFTWRWVESRGWDPS